MNTCERERRHAAGASPGVGAAVAAVLVGGLTGGAVCLGCEGKGTVRRNDIYRPPQNKGRLAVPKRGIFPLPYHAGKK